MVLRLGPSVRQLPPWSKAPSRNRLRRRRQPRGTSRATRTRVAQRELARHLLVPVDRANHPDATGCRSRTSISTGVPARRSARGQRLPRSESDWVGLGNFGGDTPASPESWPGYHDAPYYVTQATWSRRCRTRLLLEAGFSRFHYIWAGFGQAPPDRINLIPVTEQAAIHGHRANFTYRGIVRSAGLRAGRQRREPEQLARVDVLCDWCAQPEVRLSGFYQKSLQGRQANESLLRYTFNNGTPTSASASTSRPDGSSNDRTADESLFASGPVDVRQVHASGRAALRPGVELGAGGGQRHLDAVAVHLRADQLPAHRRASLATMTSPHAGVGVGRLRYRQDGAPREHRQVSPDRVQ